LERLKGVLLLSLCLLLESLDAKLLEVVGVRVTGRYAGPAGTRAGLALEEARDRPYVGEDAFSPSESCVASSCNTFCLAATGREDFGNSLYKAAIRSRPGVSL
jgi:hypothetical protein